MYRYIKGSVQEIVDGHMVVENNGIGYLMSVSHNTMHAAEIGEDIKIYTKLIVREDEMSLCGFIETEEMEMFELLIGVSSIGPKSAMNILSFPEAGNMPDYIMGGDVKSLSKFPGIGKKTAERIILELRDKLKKKNIGQMGMAPLKKTDSGSQNEAIQALMALGYSQAESAEAVGSVTQESADAQEIIKLALKHLMR